jgi:hypothetical protein
MHKMVLATALVVVAAVLAAPAHAGWPGDPAKCKPDAVKAGSVCMDKYEASVCKSRPPTLQARATKG